MLLATAAVAGTPPSFRHAWPVMPGAAGPNRLAVDWPRRPPRGMARGSIQASAPGEGESGFKVDLDELVTVDRLWLSGRPVPVLKRARIASWSES